MRFTPAQLSHTRRRAEEFERQALDNARSMHRIRKGMRLTIARLSAMEWEAAFGEDLNPARSQAMRLNIPRMHRELESSVRDIRTYEESMTINVRAATAEKRVLDRYARAQAPRREPGLWVLLQVCLRGWLAGRGKRC